MKIIIIEDEKLSAEHLAGMLQMADKSIEIVKYLESVRDCIRTLNTDLACDLIFMDIHLADGNCFKIFDQIKIETPIIFTTAFDRYALDAFKQFSIDYLLKPISFNDVCASLEKYKKYHQHYVAVNYLQFNNHYKSRFIVRSGRIIDSIAVSDIHHFESRDSTTFLVNMNMKKFIIDYTLDELSKILPTKDFFRINRKVIVHIQAIQKINTYPNSRLLLRTINQNLDSQIVSRERVHEFKNWLNR
ncbi:MAG: response regulator transcription factor [Chitinophagaceae bacterium]|jgi:DNA-binding LytR/AlgR family response regulator|nr:response regulator transcription factor [Chitinophagaceae bacterium]MCE2973326.1 LytTR family DNA-binding domain-containing protein [Sediminibacterium sp.]MCA6469943.1 response regulator transcription factor [Chitinophagaceae bacterium]MCA6477648.1 response regulator transcription factor [Chitinophagaceae bacterium]MCA6513341.1 response regulator transcription factor [Chitinophagaceae bacterium]